MKVVYSVVTPGKAAGSQVAPVVDSGLLGPEGPSRLPAQWWDSGEKGNFSKILLKFRQNLAKIWLEDLAKIPEILRNFWQNLAKECKILMKF